MCWLLFWFYYQRVFNIINFYFGTTDWLWCFSKGSTTKFKPISGSRNIGILRRDDTVYYEILIRKDHYRLIWELVFYSVLVNSSRYYQRNFLELLFPLYTSICWLWVSRILEFNEIRKSPYTDTPDSGHVRRRRRRKNKQKRHLSILLVHKGLYSEEIQ